MVDELFLEALRVSNRISAMEDKIAMEWYGCKYDDLDEDERGEVTEEAYDRLA